MTRASVEVLPVRVAHTSSPIGTAIPFDRMLVAQALAETMTLVSKDTLLARYGVPVVWE